MRYTEITIYVNPENYKWLLDAAKNNHETVSYIINDIIETYRKK